MSNRAKAIKRDLLEIANALQEGHEQPVYHFTVIHDALNLIAAMEEEVDLLRARAPRAYILTRKSEWLRLFREIEGYLQTCLTKHGTDREGRAFAMSALRRIVLELERPARETNLTGLNLSEAVSPPSPDKTQEDGK